MIPLLLVLLSFPFVWRVFFIFTDLIPKMLPLRIVAGLSTGVLVGLKVYRDFWQAARYYGSVASEVVWSEGLVCILGFGGVAGWLVFRLIWNENALRAIVSFLPTIIIAIVLDATLPHATP